MLHKGTDTPKGTAMKKTKEEKKRIDLLISSEKGKFCICIENKIWTNEHDDQTIKYFTYITGDKTFSKDIVFDQKYQKPI